MTKPPTSVRSIRLPDELWAWLAQTAEKEKQSVNALVVSAIVEHRHSGGLPAYAKLVSGEELARRHDALGRPDLASAIRAVDEAFKPPRAPYGSRLKKR